MSKPLSLLFRAGGIQPTLTADDKYFTACSVLIQAVSCGVQIYYLFTLDLHVISTFTNVGLLVLFYVSSIIQVLKVLLSKNSFRSLVEQVERNRNTSDCKFEVMTCLCVAGAYLTRQLSWYSFPVSLIKDAGAMIAYLSIVQQSVMVRQLTASFSAINNQLTAVSEATPRVLRRELASVFRAHARLRDLVKEINSFFAMFNICSILSRLFVITFIIYNQLINMTALSPSLQWTPITTLLTVVIFTVLQLELCYRCDVQANLTVRIALGMVDQHTPLEVQNEIHMFSLAVFDNAVKFSAAGVVTLDRTLIKKATMATVTCLIVALQLKDSPIPGFRP